MICLCCGGQKSPNAAWASGNRKHRKSLSGLYCVQNFLHFLKIKTQVLCFYCSCTVIYDKTVHLLHHFILNIFSIFGKSWVEFKFCGFEQWRVTQHICKIWNHCSKISGVNRVILNTENTCLHPSLPLALSARQTNSSRVWALSWGTMKSGSQPPWSHPISLSCLRGT